MIFGDGDDGDFGRKVLDCLFIAISEEEPENKFVDEADKHLVDKGLVARPADVVGAGEVDYCETEDYKKLALLARTLVGRSTRAANVMREEAKKRRIIATPHNQTRTLESKITSAAGREASSAVIAAAMPMSVDKKWTIGQLLGGAHLTSAPQYIIGPLSGWAL